jgi:hypothetical protein
VEERSKRLNHERLQINKTITKTLNLKTMAKAKKTTSTISLISTRAKKIWKKGSEKWTSAISRASKELKAEGKI